VISSVIPARFWRGFQQPQGWSSSVFQSRAKSLDFRQKHAGMTKKGDSTMRLIFAAAISSLILAGCTFSPNVSINGTDLLDSTIRESAPGVAEFACNASVRCYYAVFTSECRNDASDAATSVCTTRHIADFALAHGESKELTGLPSGYKHCVARTAPVAPYCAGAAQG
jgi:hypothetical protein